MAPVLSGTIRCGLPTSRRILRKTSRGVTSSLPRLERNDEALDESSVGKHVVQLKTLLKLFLTTCHFEYSIRYYRVYICHHLMHHSIWCPFHIAKIVLGCYWVGIARASIWSYLRQSLRSGSADMADMRKQEGAKANCSEMASKCSFRRNLNCKIFQIGQTCQNEHKRSRKQLKTWVLGQKVWAFTRNHF